MSQQHDQDLQQEQQLLEHFREHSQGEPSAAMDTLILAVARQAVEPPRPSLSQRLHAWLFGAGNRTRWSMAVAGLAVFGIGLNLALHTREQLPEPLDAPPALQEMAPAMEARKQVAEREYKKAEQAQESFAGGMDPSASYSASPPAAAPQPMAPAKPQSAPVQALADSVATPVEADAAREQARGQAAANAKAQSGAPVDNALHEELSEEQLAESLGHSSVAEAAPLELRLRGVLQLRREGRQDEAERLLTALKREYPQEDLDAALKRLQAEAAKPDSSP